MGDELRSSDLQPGARLMHKDGKVVVLDHRKTRNESTHPGWWLRDGAGGLADFVIDSDSDWAVLAAGVSTPQPEDDEK